MSFLDRFKPQPRWKHADAATRAAAVVDIPEDDEFQEALDELTRDEDVRVRRAAVARVTGPTALVALARSEADQELRRELSDRLVAIATAPASSESDAAAALAGLEEPRQVSTVAKTSPHDAVRTSALDRIQEPKALGSVARHAADPRTASDAVARLSDVQELRQVALRTEHREAGVAALERCVSDGALDEGGVRDLLDTVQTRARSKAVSKRARAILQAMQEAEAARRAALEQWQQRVASVVARVEAIAANPSAPTAERELADVQAEWGETAGSGTAELDPETAARYGALVEAARTGLAAHQRAEAEKRAAAEHAAALRAVRLSLCERLEHVAAEQALTDLDVARGEWEGLPESADEPADRDLQARFLEACHAAVERHDNHQDRERIGARLEALAVEAERLTSESPVAEEPWRALQQEWEALQARSTVLDAAVAERYRAAEARVRLGIEERKAAEERALRLQVQRVDQLVERATTRAAAEDLTLREADRLARELRA
ncbi:MAG: hypothetical protein ABI603_12930, partial [Acidobacteriota bacterium]